MTTASKPCATTDLTARRVAVLPEPQAVNLDEEDIEFTSRWWISDRTERPETAAAVAAFNDYLSERHGIVLSTSGAADACILLTTDDQDLPTAGATDHDAAAVAQQGYRLRLRPDQIQISASSGAGTFYGLITLVQLLTASHGRRWLPTGAISDWPDLSRRFIFWDGSEHLDRTDTLKRAIRQAAFYKVNGFVLKLDSHYMYASAPEVVAPDALSPDELQELTDYGLKYHVQVIPYIDAPGHLAWVLKHPEYAHLREFAECNYELCTADPAAHRLLEGLFDDLLAANKGVDYFVLSTDEPYYLGQGRSRQRAAELGGIGRLEADFVSRAAGYLRDRGRTVQIWGEYPIERADIPYLPPHVINGIMNGPKYDGKYAEAGIRQLIYTNVQGEMPYFPDYHRLPPPEQLNPIDSICDIQDIHRTMSFHPTRNQKNIAGAYIAAWADAGLHPETFWLGFILAASWAWHPGLPSPDQAMDRFQRLFYGAEHNDAVALSESYRLLSRQAQAVASLWDKVDSTARTGIFGGPYEVYESPRPASDAQIPMPPVPHPASLYVEPTWIADNQRRMSLTRQFIGESEQLVSLLEARLGTTKYNQHNVDILYSVATLLQQNLTCVQDVSRISDALVRASAAAADGRPRDAVAYVDFALAVSEHIRRQRNDALRLAEQSWSASMFLKRAAGNGRTQLHVFDDVKDHLPDRTLDMSYLVQPQLLLPFNQWFEQTRDARNSYAESTGQPPRNGNLDWENYAE